MKRSKGERCFEVINIVFMILLSIITLYPYLNQVAVSFNEGFDSMRGGITIFPRKPTLENYKAVLENGKVVRAAILTVTRVVLHGIMTLLITYSAAYGLSRKGLPYKRGLTLFLMIPAYVTAGVIPFYITLRSLGMINSYSLYLLLGLFTFYNMVIFRSFLQEIPASIEESAKIDGANELIIMFKIMIPMSLPVIATVALWVMVGDWNDWTTTLMYVSDEKKYTLQYLMMRIIKEADMANELAMQNNTSLSMGESVKMTSESVKSATLICTTLPIIMVYPFLQKYFIKGVTLGAVKE